MGHTDDRRDPALKRTRPDGQQEKYLVLSEEERKRGFVRPVLRSYQHLTCLAITTMSLPLAETYARDPKFYGATYCTKCRGHFPVGENGEFVWVINKVTPEDISQLRERDIDITSFKVGT